MAAFSHNGEPGSALDRELRGVGCARCDRLSSDLGAAQEARERAEAIVAAIILSYNPQELIGDLKKRGNEILERAQRAEARAEEYRNELDRFKEEREGNTRQFRRLQERLAQAEADAFSMSAGQCIVTNGGLMGDDHGHLYCDMQRQRDEARRAAERIWAAAVEVIDAERKWSYSQPTIQALRELEAAIAEGK